MIDAFRSSMWEQLDDYVYYIRATGNSIEFIFGIFLFFNGAWILLFESGGTIRALMMCIHAYFNIWCQAIAGMFSISYKYIHIFKFLIMHLIIKVGKHLLNDVMPYIRSTLYRKHRQSSFATLTMFVPFVIKS